MDLLAKDILQFWFGPLDEKGRAQADKMDRWFRKDPAFDEEIRRKYGEYLFPAAWGAYDRWCQNDKGRVALIIMLDQFPRNLYRNQAKAFYFDGKALFLSKESINSEHFLRVPSLYGYFSLMPTMHAESLEAQELGIQAFRRLEEAANEELKPIVADGINYAIRHRDIIARFGRFPHRNAILGRETTEEEAEFLKQPGSSF